MLLYLARPSLLLACLLPLVAGCDSAPPPPATHPVHGTVRLDGKLLEDGVVEFQPLDDAGHRAQGEIQPDGTYKLSILHDRKRIDGAVPGEYRVTILFMAKKETDKRPPQTLETTYQVVEGDNLINLELKNPATD